MLYVCIQVQTILPLEAQVRNATSAGALPAPSDDAIRDQRHYIDNLFTVTWKKLEFNAQLRGSGLHQARNRHNGSCLSITDLEVDWKPEWASPFLSSLGWNFLFCFIDYTFCKNTIALRGIMSRINVGIFDAIVGNRPGTIQHQQAS